MAAVAAKLGIDPAWLNAQIEFESAWDPQATNQVSGARGLIQFEDAAARDLGFADADTLVAQYPDSESQLLNPVYNWYALQQKRYGAFTTMQAFCMSVFYPKAMTWPADWPFPDTVREENPGINTPQDYVNRVNLAPPIQVVKSAALPGAIALLVIGAAYLYMSKRGA
jgi:hypothetical protein